MLTLLLVKPDCRVQTFSSVMARYWKEFISDLKERIIYFLQESKMVSKNDYGQTL